MPNTIPAAGEAMPESKHADIRDLESPIADATRMASIHARLLTNSLSRENFVGNRVYLTGEQLEDILFSAYHVQELIKKIFTQWEASV